MNLAVFQTPLPTGIGFVFSVDLTSAARGKPEGSCFTSAARYWSMMPLKHARSHEGEAGMFAASAFPDRPANTPNANNATTKLVMRRSLGIVPPGNAVRARNLYQKHR